MARDSDKTFIGCCRYGDKKWMFFYDGEVVVESGSVFECIDKAEELGCKVDYVINNNIITVYSVFKGE
jgi:hypothetical protein